MSNIELCPRCGHKYNHKEERHVRSGEILELPFGGLLYVHVLIVLVNRIIKKSLQEKRRHPNDC